MVGIYKLAVINKKTDMEEKIALLLNHVDRGAVLTSLQANNYYRTLKLLNTSSKNWESICRILENDTENEILVLAKFTESALFRMCLPEYLSIAKRMFELIKSKRHLIFIYKSNLYGEFSYFKNETDFFDFPDNDTFYHADARLDAWLKSNKVSQSDEDFLTLIRERIKVMNDQLNVLPYEKLIDMEIASQNFIEHVAEGLIFRIYVPNDRIWSNEFDKFIILFRDYASSVANEELKITQNRTDSGTICSLYSINKNFEPEKMNELYNEFTSFMDLCSSNTHEAEEIINNLSIDKIAKDKIIKKYVKESKRLLLDIRQEREVKLINIKHRLQNELQEIEISKELLEYINSSIPDSESKNIILGSQVIQNQNFYINSQIIEKVDGIVANELNGNINLAPEEQQILKLIEKYSLDIANATDLKTALYELKDTASTKEAKRSSWQKIYGFIGKVADKVGDVGVALLTKYIEQKMNS